MRLAVLADVHGNSLALAAVLADLERRGGADLVVNLGDCVSGPLWPGETCDLLERLGAITVRGNHDRQVGTADRAAMLASDVVAYDALSPARRAWLAALPVSAEPAPGILAVHGTPSDDETYLLDRIVEGGMVRDVPERIAERLGPTAARIILCGHSHRADIVRMHDGRLVINPGSVGGPAYRDDSPPAPHRSESGTPQARYCMLEFDGVAREAPRVTLIAVPYDHEAAARRAEELGRPDWGAALRTGFIS